MDHQRIFFSTYLAFLYGGCLNLLTNIMIYHQKDRIFMLNIMDPRIHWGTILGSCIYYVVSPNLTWYIGQDEFRNTLVKWKMRGSTYVGMSILYPFLTMCLTDIVLLSLGEKVEHMVDRMIYMPQIAMLLTAVCELCGVNRSIRVAYVNQ